ncbi:hypothetical protein RJT34_00972 [Clitoria ternatea]|uniref:Cyclotide n=1 Tax=Clitoria ternatea TaxID=43366 RepID=A0AAN9KHQ9_CLITE
MVGIPKATFFSAVFIAICVFPPVIAEYGSSSEIRLPSEVAGEKNVCGNAVPSSCPVNCFRADPVCSVDGVTYWCGCTEAACAGAQVAKLGFCEVWNDGSAALSGQALLLVHIVWLIVLGFAVFFGLF